jgi:hypothetical protein
VHGSSSRVGCGKCSKKIIGSATGERCRFCIARAPAKNFRIFFAATLKFRATRPITHSDDRDWVLKKFFAGTLKFRKRRPITLSDVRKWIEKKFVETLKFGKNGPIKALWGCLRDKKFFLRNPKVPETVDVNQHSSMLSAASKGRKRPRFHITLLPLFHRGAPTIRQGLSDKLLRVAFVFAGRKIQTLSNSPKVSSQSESISTATHNASQIRSTER